MNINLLYHVVKIHPAAQLLHLSIHPKFYLFSLKHKHTWPMLLDQHHNYNKHKKK